MMGEWLARRRWSFLDLLIWQAPVLQLWRMGYLIIGLIWLVVGTIIVYLIEEALGTNEAQL